MFWPNNLTFLYDTGLVTLAEQRNPKTNMYYKQQFGKLSEKLAVKFLKKQGYKILSLNYRCPLGEVDIVGLEKDTVVFIEVRSRSNSSCGMPMETINFDKKKHIIRTALYYQKRYNLYDYNVRFDIVSVLKDETTQKLSIELIKDAFDERGY